MYLKSIEIQGFKSFANKIVFEFHNGITAIVGPNGSGKSNVADAVRWVLGEQRVKQLRGGSMQDVIFAGTEMRKPQGFAYVAITLDNSDHQLAIDFEQVTISRRLYRSGESEYMINGNVCRLKDVNELFYDTGIGKEGYSIIGQGQIDKILSGKPEERRELFDEAAGIVKFKRRKVIAQKKLEAEKQNLVRVNDILTELEKQVGPLERQAESAKKYLQLKEELKTYDVNAFLLDMANIKLQQKDVEDRERMLNEDLSESREKARALKQEYDELDERLTGLDEELTAKRSRLSEENVQKGNLEGRINVLYEQINTEKMNEEHLQNRTRAITAELAEKNRQVAAYEAEKADLSAVVNAALEKQKEAEIALMDRDLAIQELEERIAGTKDSVIHTLNERASVSAKQQRYETMQEQVNARRSEVNQKLLKIKSEEALYEEQKAAETDKLTAAESDIAGLLQKEAELEESGRQQQEEVRRLNRNLADAQQLYQTSYTKLDSLKNIAERYEGYGNSIRRVMEVKDRIRGIHGVVADLITVEKKYEIAIETALGGSIQNIVTDSDQTAKQLIEYLKKNKYGRATFLPMSSMGRRTGFQQEKALQEPGVLGLANQLVSADGQYQGLLNYLLGRVVVAENIDAAIALAKKFQYSLRIVTLDGELLSAGGSMTGGAFKNTSNLLGRKREIEELEGRCEKALQASDKIQQELGGLEAVMEAAKTRLEQLKQEKQQLFLARNTIQMNLSQLDERIIKTREASVEHVRENNQLVEQSREIKEQLTQLAANVHGLEEKNQAAGQAIDDLGAQLSGLKAGREEQAKSLSAAQLDHANMQQKDDFLQENLRRVEEEIRKLTEELNSQAAGQQSARENIEKRLAEIETLKDSVRRIIEDTAQINQALQQLSAKKESCSQKQKGFFEQREQVAERISALDKDAFRLQSQKEKLDERMENQVNYMWNEYEITLSAAQELKDPRLGPLPEIKKHIEALKTSIKGLGNVNVNAIEDYKEVSARYEFLKTQHDDLVLAEEALLKIIDELDMGMRIQFEQQFGRIKAEFDVVFKEMFGGGRGTLELMEGEDILEAGIQIISQPPGKKLQNMMQLSGGEKALTAIALLFAIQNLKPSPFCLLDEIEAALDDSNVDRFAGYLHKLTENTQFIVITHRRGTMVASDRLYGITMQEKGVSTLVSVNLIEAQLGN